MEFIIDRSTWRCGDESMVDNNRLGIGSTKLLNSNGYMCCLGQIALQLGATKEKIFGAGDPSDIIYFENAILLDSDFNNSSLSSDAMDINDNTETSVVEKEQKLKELFEGYKHNIEFIN